MHIIISIHPQSIRAKIIFNGGVSLDNVSSLPHNVPVVNSPGDSGGFFFDSEDVGSVLESSGGEGFRRGNLVWERKGKRKKKKEKKKKKKEKRKKEKKKKKEKEKKIKRKNTFQFARY